MILTINSVDYTNYITGYEVNDDSNVLLKSTTMASGEITQVYAPYTQTSLKVRMKLSQAQIQTLYGSLGLSNALTYYSAKTGATKAGLFSYSDDGYALKRKTAHRENYDEITFTFVKLGDVPSL